MSWRIKFNVLPSIGAEERVLYFKNWLWAASGKSLPSYRLFFSLPPLWEAGFYVTDRRVLLMSHVLRLFTFEISQWYQGADAADDEEFVRSTRVGRHRVLGPFLEVVSHNPVKRWYRSHELRIRFFIRNPEIAEQIISDAMAAISRG